MKWTLLMLALFLIIPSVHAAATIADIYRAPSEAELFYSGGTSECQDLNVSCSDDDYGSVTDKYAALGDGATSAASGAVVKDSGNSQSSLLKLVYDVEGVLQGTYYLRFAMLAPGTFDYAVCTYINETHVNTSSCIFDTHTDTDTWHDVAIADLVSESANRFNNRIYLRFYVFGASQTLTEVYLKRPFKLADIDILPMGVTEAEPGTRIENMWTFISQSEVPAITGGWCEIKKLVLINETPAHVLINTTDLNMEFDVADDYTYFKVYWMGNTSVENFEEGFNYEVECGGYLGDLEMSGFSQFVYINREKTMWENILSMIQYLLQIIGITQDTNELISARAEMVDSRIGMGGEGYATTFLTYADGTVNANASCYLDIWYPNSTQWIDQQSMTVVGSDGRYLYSITTPYVDGLYQMRSFCNGTALMNRTKYAYANLEVYDDVRMWMIS